MIFVSVYGGSKAKQNQVDKLVNFAIDTLMPRVSKLEIDVELGCHDTQGGCIADGRTFQIEIDSKIKDDDFITCIFHEMVHVWQHVSKKLIEKNGRSYWNGVDHTNTSYLDQPWEIEAYKMQETLLEKWNGLHTT